MALSGNLSFGGAPPASHVWPVFPGQPLIGKSTSPLELVSAQSLYILLCRVSHSTVFACLLVLLTTYLLVVRHLRFRAIRALEEKYGATMDEFKNIDYKDAQGILANLFLLEAPWLFLTSKDFAFLRVCLCVTSNESSHSRHD